MKSKKKVSQYDIDRQNNKLFSLERRLQFLINQHVELKEKFNKIMKENKNSCDLLQIKEKEKSNIPQYKKDYAKSKELEKQKHDLMFKLETFKNEHLSIKQKLEEYENKKKKLQSKYDRLLKENNELKNREEEIDYYINERKIEKKGLEDYLNEKIKEETQLRNFFENEYKKLKEEKKNYVPPKKKFDLTINPSPDNNNNINNNNNNNNIFDFQNISNVIGSNDGDKISLGNQDIKHKNFNDDKNEDKNLINSLNNINIINDNKNKINKNENPNKEKIKDIGVNSGTSNSNSVSVSIQSSDSENSD